MFFTFSTTIYIKYIRKKLLILFKKIIIVFFKSKRLLLVFRLMTTQGKVLSTLNENILLVVLFFLPRGKSCSCVRRMDQQQVVDQVMREREHSSLL
jgi:hypothetical protein